MLFTCLAFGIFLCFVFGIVYKDKIVKFFKDNNFNLSVNQKYDDIDSLVLDAKQIYEDKFSNDVTDRKVYVLDLETDFDKNYNYSGYIALQVKSDYVKYILYIWDGSKQLIDYDYTTSGTPKTNDFSDYSDSFINTIANNKKEICNYNKDFSLTCIDYNNESI